jgi:hypothetical protein
MTCAAVWKKPSNGLGRISTNTQCKVLIMNAPKAVYKMWWRRESESAAFLRNCAPNMLILSGNQAYPAFLADTHLTHFGVRFVP